MVTWLAYAAGVAGLLAVGALSFEKLCERTGWPRRFGWLAALSLGLLIPLTASPPATDVQVAAAATVTRVPTELESYRTAAPPGTATPAEAGSPVDAGSTATGAAERTALVLWGSTSLAALFLICTVLIAAAFARRHWDRRRIAGENVYVSRRFGPALVGVARPAIVIPRWVVRLGDAVGATVVRHEREHARARDHVALLYAGIVLALMPWNPAIWWMFLRLRTAVEIDCDRRVLASGVPAAEYGDLLLDIGSGRPARPFFALAMASSGTMLERRLKAMRNQGNNVRRSAVALFGCAALAAIAIACGVPAPAGIAPAVNAALAEPAEADQEAPTDAARRLEAARAAEQARQETEQAQRAAEQTRQETEQAQRAAEQARQERAETLRRVQQASQEMEQAQRAAELARQARAGMTLLERAADLERATQRLEATRAALARRASAERQQDDLERATQRLEAARAAFARRVSAERQQDDLERILQRLSELLEELKERSGDAKWMRDAADELLGDLEEFRSGAQRVSAATRAEQEAGRAYAERVAEARERSADARLQASAARARADEEREEAAVRRAEATTAREEADAALQRANAELRAATGEAAKAAAAARQREAMLRVLTAASAENEAAFREAYSTWRESAAAALEKALAELEEIVAEYRSGGRRGGR